MADHTPLTPEREQEFRDSIPTVYGPPWTVHPDMEGGSWRVLYATDHPLAGLVAEIPDYGAHLAEFIAMARVAVPELLDELDRLRTDAAAVLLPAWEAVYEPGNVSDYLIGYANDQDAATGAAEAWMRSQAEVTGRLEWVPQSPLEGYDCEFELIQRHDDGVDTGPGITVRRRRAAPAAEEQQAAACGKCRTPFDPADTRFDGHAQYGVTPYCRRCVDLCHDNEIADHRCVICA